MRDMLFNNLTLICVIISSNLLTGVVGFFRFHLINEIKLILWAFKITVSRTLELSGAHNYSCSNLVNGLSCLATCFLLFVYTQTVV